MGKVLLLVFPNFSEFEIAVACTVVGMAHEIVTVGLDLAPVTGEGGLSCVPHLAVDDVDPASYEGIIIPGGVDMIHLKDAEGLFSSVRQFSDLGKPVAAICGGPFVPGRAGLLTDRRYTASFTNEQRSFLELPEATYVDADVVRSGDLLTAKGSAFVDFGLEAGHLFGAYRDDDHAREVSAFYHNKKAI